MTDDVTTLWDAASMPCPVRSPSTNSRVQSSATCVEIDVVIVGHDGSEVLEGLIRSLHMSIGVLTNVVVVDNGSSDCTADLAAKAGAHVIELGENIGYGAAFNLGLKATEAEWIVCANQDTVAEPHCLMMLVQAVGEYERLTGRPAIAGPSLVGPGGRLSETWHQLPSFWMEMLELVLGEGVAGLRSRPSFDLEYQECGWISAAFVLGRRTTFERLGGFDPSYFMYGEDVDLFSRLGAAGGRGLWIPAARVTHFGGDRLVIDPLLFCHSLWGWGNYFEKTHRRLGKRAILLAGLVGAAVRVVVWGAREAIGVANARDMRRAFSRVVAIHVRTTLSGRRPPTRL